MNRSKHYILAKSIIILLLLSSVQINVAQAKAASLLFSTSAHPCQMSSGLVANHEHKGNPDSISLQSDHLCLHCQDISNHCQNNCNTASTIGVPFKISMDLQTTHTSLFYTYVNFLPEYHQQPLLRPPR